MKFARFSYQNKTSFGVVERNTLKVIDGNPFSDWNYSGEQVPLDHAELLSPVTPQKVIGIGANYVEKKEALPEELPEIPVFFLKPTSSIIGPEAPVSIPEGLDEVKFESELAVVIGKEAKNIEKEDVLDHIFGYTIGNDVTAPQFFHSDGHWTLGKAFDTFTPLGPVIETDLDPSKVFVKAEVNGEQKQNSPTECMIVPLKEMISYLSKVMTLHTGDVILTGSPLGAHFVKHGDVVKCTIDEIGDLTNSIASSKVEIPQ
ncbi:fumarylacetoacetate hydrolase family protein [Alkalihalobacillus sp. CinArs1]|uniref:fumarylacetoacetate hydrolase family protein n=1 Tax=Alkalihalobacillus sp. CinArs1 TaxID=2995314 RepID=UPI0022DE594C|nr:fumarylacetoacetate hydrolase family protein [Alkalihalobacillus sp. CinArs1]